MTRLEKYGIPLAVAANLVCQLIAGRRTLPNFNPSSMIVALGGLCIACLAGAILFTEHRRPRMQ